MGTLIGTAVIIMLLLSLVLIPSSSRHVQVGWGAGAVLLATALVLFLEHGPRDYIIRVPALRNWLHPYRVAPDAFGAIMFGDIVSMAAFIKGPPTTTPRGV